MHRQELQKMSVGEIEEAQAELRKRFSPELLAFLQGTLCTLPPAGFGLRLSGRGLEAPSSLWLIT